MNKTSYLQNNLITLQKGICGEMHCRTAQYDLLGVSLNSFFSGTLHRHRTMRKCRVHPRQSGTSSKDRPSLKFGGRLPFVEGGSERGNDERGRENIIAGKFSLHVLPRASPPRNRNLRCLLVIGCYAPAGGSVRSAIEFSSARAPTAACMSIHRYMWRVSLQGHTGGWGEMGEQCFSASKELFTVCAEGNMTRSN